MDALIVRYAMVAAMMAAVGCDRPLPPPPRSMPIGQRPALTLRDDSGAPLELGSLRGRPTLVIFFRGAS
jgi:cytochrome oxidase Cu insertion factor (SCO1/SenC/PrrC family)